MKTLLLTLLSLCLIGNAETADQMARQAITQFAPYNNGLDQSPEGRRKTALNNADFSLAHYMASDAVPEKVRLAYALRELRGQLDIVIHMGPREVDAIETQKMKERVNSLIQLLEARLVEISSPGFTEEVFVHFTGQVKSPGVYKVATKVTVEDLAKACGGWSEFGTAKRLKLIRLARPANATTEDPGERETKVYEFAEIPREDGKLILKKGDIVFIPEKQVIGQ